MKSIQFYLANSKEFFNNYANISNKDKITFFTYIEPYHVYNYIFQNEEVFDIFIENNIYINYNDNEYINFLSRCKDPSMFRKLIIKKPLTQQAILKILTNYWGFNLIFNTITPEDFLKLGKLEDNFIRLIIYRLDNEEDFKTIYKFIDKKIHKTLLNKVLDKVMSYFEYYVNYTSYRGVDDLFTCHYSLYKFFNHTYSLYKDEMFKKAYNNAKFHYNLYNLVCLYKYEEPNYTDILDQLLINASTNQRFIRYAYLNEYQYLTEKGKKIIDNIKFMRKVGE